MKPIYLWGILILAQCSISLADTTFTWGTLFVPKRMESGDTVSVGALAGSGDTLFLYDISSNSIVLLSSDLSLLKTVQLSNSPRKGWAGDDFVVTANGFVFLCAQDRCIDRYDRFTGRLVSRTTIPASILASEPSRSARILSHIFLDNGELFVGNTRCAIAFSPGLSKAKGAVRRPDDGKRIAAIQFGRIWELQENRLMKLKGASFSLPAQQYEIPGKRVALADLSNSWIVTCTRRGLTLNHVPLQ